MNTTISTEQLTELFRNANWNKITVEINGDTLTIDPCSQCLPTTEENVEYFIVEGSDYAHTGALNATTVEGLAKKLNSIEKVKTEHEDDKQKLADYYAMWIENGNYTEEQWEWYSDWHKDIYGYRPGRRPR